MTLATTIAGVLEQNAELIQPLYWALHDAELVEYQSSGDLIATVSTGIARWAEDDTHVSDAIGNILAESEAEHPDAIDEIWDALTQAPH